MFSCQHRAAAARGAGLLVTFEGPDAPEPQEFDRILVSVGRSANGDAIDAAAAGVNVDKRGIIGVDKQMRTNVAHIFAIGDADAADIGLTIHAHPTLSETVGLSAEAFEGTLTDLYLPKH